MPILRVSWLLCCFFLFFKAYSSSNPGSTPFVTTWKTDNNGDSNSNQIIIPTTGTGYSYTVDWGDGTQSANETGNAIHTYASPGIYTVSITGDFPRIFFNGTGDIDKIISIDQWGDNLWDSMLGAFRGCGNLEGNFSDSPNLSQVSSMSYMFYDADEFNTYIGDWEVSNITDMSFLFSGALDFNQDIGNWDVSNVTNMAHMFDSATSFNQDIGNWDVSNVINMSNMFYYTISFSQSLDNWNVSSVEDMSYMFTRANSFNGAIGNWIVSNVQDMSYMFFDAVSFNQDIGNWDVSIVQDMSYMFTSAVSFDQNIGNWNVSNVSNMAVMFFEAISFNQDISSWNLNNVVDMSNMFEEALSFNHDIGSWDVSNVLDMSSMFSGAISFDQDIGNWDVSNVIDMSDMFEGVTLSATNYDGLLIGWNSGNLQLNVSFSGGLSQYCEGASARENMIANSNWQITDGGTSGPTIDELSDLSVPNFYVLPVIAGINLTGNEKYYTEPNGSGMSYNSGDVIGFNDFSSYPIVLYIYDNFSLGCGSEQSFELTITSDLSCTTLALPFTGQTDVPVDTDISWNLIIEATGYRLSIGTSFGTYDILNNADVGNVLSYDVPGNLPVNSIIYLKIIPYSDEGILLSCPEESFTTVSNSDLNNKLPKFFTPNNDGINDRWTVPDPLNQISRIMILNRYGKLFLDLFDFSKGWDGNYKNQSLPVDDYWYIIYYRTGEIIKGHFSLIR